MYKMFCREEKSRLNNKTNSVVSLLYYRYPRCKFKNVHNLKDNDQGFTDTMSLLKTLTNSSNFVLITLK